MDTRNKTSAADNTNPFEILSNFYKDFNIIDAEFYKNNIEAFSKYRENIFENIMKYYDNLFMIINELVQLNKNTFHASCSKGNNFFTSEATSNEDISAFGKNLSDADEEEFIPSIEDQSSDIDEASEDDSDENLDIFPASGHDVLNHLSQINMPFLQIQAILNLDGRLSLEKINKAIRLSLDVEPVFGCKFVEGHPPFWKRLDNLDQITFCSIEETDNPDEAVKLFIQKPLNVDSDANIKAKLIPLKDHDILALKINNACCDGTYAKEYIQLLSNIYSCIEQKGVDFKAESRIDTMVNESALYEELGKAHPELNWNQMLDFPKTMWAFPWRNSGRDEIRYAINRITHTSLDSLKQYGKSRGATLNDLILTSFYRAMFKLSKPIYGIPMDITFKTDLRSYIDDNRSRLARNFTGSFITSIAKISNESFEGTLSRVVRAQADVRAQTENSTHRISNSSRPTGISGAVGEEYLGKTCYSYLINYSERLSKYSEIYRSQPYYVGNICFPEFYDLGSLSSALIKFGDTIVSDAYLLPPAIRAPGFMLFSNSYNDVLTLSIGYYKDSVSHKDMESLLNAIEKELLRACSCEKD
ncbi:hypothetical protein EHE19_005875 [Ruminiclostridium herbifermentans]|uniref:Uncharacterized protein n=1 Tax=Ruminiclostridium herbifermentans TaxID=2488810 RepID=A0A4U7JDQ7_9FIRM|nr:hypothetical protein [Ruminiclostridium herbifermentans]QNU67969.1 hypothetical protein EHE19_005875 [Ruminiclostridium herbifermentans]